MTEKDAERQFEIEASTMSREQIYDLAKRLWLENAQHYRVRDEHIANLSRDLAEARGKLEEFAKQYECGCSQRYTGGKVQYHGHDCENRVARDFVDDFLAKKA